MDPILFFCFPAIGDFVRCHSAIQIVAERFPGRPIDVVTSPMAVGLARLMPHVRKGWALDKRHMRLGVAERRRLVDALRAENYRTAYMMTSSTKASLIPFLAGIPERIGYPRELQFGLMNRFPAGWIRNYWAFGPRKTRLYEEVCAIAAMGERPECGWPAPRLVVPPQEVDEWRRRQNIDPQRPALALYTSAFENFRAWPVERMVSIARDYVGRGWSVWLVGGQRERPSAAAIRTMVPEAMDFTSTPDLAEAMTQIAASTLFLGVDGGISHAAAAVGAPCVLIFGSNRSYVHGPVNGGVRLLEPPIATPSWVEDTRGILTDRVLRELADLTLERHGQAWSDANAHTGVGDGEPIYE